MEVCLMAITVYSPTSGGEVTSSLFYASGTSPTGVPLYAFISQQGGRPYIGSLINFPPNYVFQFMNVPVGSGYNLCVMDYANPPEQQFVNGITVVSG
jgi:hypothetical protein